LAAGKVYWGGIDNTALSGRSIADNYLFLLALVHIAGWAWVNILKCRTLSLKTGGAPEVTFNINKITFSMADVGATNYTEFYAALVGVLEAVRI